MEHAFQIPAGFPVKSLDVSPATNKAAVASLKIQSTTSHDDLYYYP